MLVMRSEKLSDSSCYVVDRRGDEKRCNRHRGYLSRGNDVCVVVIRQISIEDNFRDIYGCYNENPCNYLAENSFTHQVLLLAADPPHSTLDYLLEQRLLMEFSMRGDLLPTSSVNRCFGKTWCVQPIGGVVSSLEDSVFFNPRITKSRRKRMIVVIH